MVLLLISHGEGLGTSVSGRASEYSTLPSLVACSSTVIELLKKFLPIDLYKLQRLTHKSASPALKLEVQAACNYGDGG